VEVTAINVRIILKCFFFLISLGICGMHFFGSKWGPMVKCFKTLVKHNVLITVGSFQLAVCFISESR
jgi:hypothetical protein